MDTLSHVNMESFNIRTYVHPYTIILLVCGLRFCLSCAILCTHLTFVEKNIRTYAHINLSPIMISFTQIILKSSTYKI